jgi:hypothetical protein
VGSSYLPFEEVAERHATIDEAAKRAGRDPAEIARIANVGLAEDPRSWLDPERLARTATELRFDTLLLAVPDEAPADFVRRLGEEAAPAARQLLGGAAAAGLIGLSDGRDLLTQPRPIPPRD